MLLGIIYCIIYTLIVKIFETHYVSEIEKGVPVYVAIKFRRKVRNTRITTFLCCIAVAVAIQYMLNRDLEPSQMFNAFWPISFMFIIMNRQNKDSPYGNFSYRSIDDVMDSEEKFVLFLRGFEKDDYTGQKKLLKKKTFKIFSEYHFFSCLRKKLDYKFYAVGMTKEIEAPFGADRVYLDDFRWKNDVKMMMSKAACIIVEINDKSSCIWEIEQCNKYPLKTFFLITDAEKYKNVYDSIIEKLTVIGKGFPRPNSVTSLICFTFPRLGKYYKTEFTFQNNIESYNELAQRIGDLIRPC